MTAKLAADARGGNIRGIRAKLPSVPFGFSLDRVFDPSLFPLNSREATYALKRPSSQKTKAHPREKTEGRNATKRKAKQFGPLAHRTKKAKAKTKGKSRRQDKQRQHTKATSHSHEPYEPKASERVQEKINSKQKERLRKEPTKISPPPPPFLFLFVFRRASQELAAMKARLKEMEAGPGASTRSLLSST